MLSDLFAFSGLGLGNVLTQISQNPLNARIRILRASLIRIKTAKYHICIIQKQISLLIIQQFKFHFYAVKSFKVGHVSQNKTHIFFFAQAELQFL